MKDANQALDDAGDYNTNFNFGSTVPPGQYIYDYFIWARHGGSSGSPPIPGDSNSTISITLKLTAVPEPASQASGLLALALATLIRKRRLPQLARPGRP